jgi:predicted HicB family RNase H-like nuclease
MTGKKIEFSRKPDHQSKDQYIDSWVSGNTIDKPEAPKLKRTTMYLTEALHKKLKIKAAEKEVSMTDLVINALEEYIK